MKYQKGFKFENYGILHEIVGSNIIKPIVKGYGNAEPLIVYYLKSITGEDVILSESEIEKLIR